MTPEDEIEYLKEKVKIYRFDYLTGLKGRRDFDHDTRKKFHSEYDFWLVYYDVNELHKTNRDKGFAQGDSLIRQVASDIQHQSIPHQSYRTSGDEFYAICCQEPTHEVDNATMVMVYSESFDNVDQMIAQLDVLMIAEKNRMKTRREDD